MDHAEVRERLELALLGPGRLDRLIHGEGEDDRELRQHVATCAACRAEADALRATADLLALGAPSDIAPSSGARERTLAAVRATGIVRPLSPAASSAPFTARSATTQAATTMQAATATPALGRLPLPRPVLAGLAAALAVAIVGSGALVALDLTAQRDAAAQQYRQLATLLAASDRLQRDPSASRATLSGPQGGAAGTVLVSRGTGELLVVVERLGQPPAGEKYGCFMERDGERTRIGSMRVDDDLGFWLGPAKIADPGRAGDRFIISFQEDGSDPVLIGAF